jgi:hypothetical protein
MENPFGSSNLRANVSQFYSSNRDNQLKNNNNNVEENSTSVSRPEESDITNPIFPSVPNKFILQPQIITSGKKGYSTTPDILLPKRV